MRDSHDAAPVQLEAEDVHIRFGGVVALAGVSVQLFAGEIAAIIGPNGAGKSLTARPRSLF